MDAPAQPILSTASVLGAARKRPHLVLLPIVVLFVAAMLISTLRAPVYTAQTRLSVGRIDVQTQAIPGLAAATQTLASSYSRLLSAEDVLQPVAASTGLSVGELSGRLSGSPIPESPLFFVEARASTAEAAVELSNLAAESLTGYVTALNRASFDSVELLKEYQAAQVQAEEARTALSSAQRAVAVSPTASALAARQKADAAYAAARLRADTLAGRYTESTQNLTSSNQIQIVNPATGAASDGASYRQRLGFTAILVGLVLGLALATFIQRTSPNAVSLRHRLSTRRRRASRARTPSTARASRSAGSRSSGPKPRPAKAKKSTSSSSSSPDSGRESSASSRGETGAEARDARHSSVGAAAPGTSSGAGETAEAARPRAADAPLRTAKNGNDETGAVTLQAARGSGGAAAARPEASEYGSTLPERRRDPGALQLARAGADSRSPGASGAAPVPSTIRDVTGPPRPEPEGGPGASREDAAGAKDEAATGAAGDD